MERIIVFDPLVKISTHDPNAIYFSDFLKLGENLPRQTEVEKLQSQANDDDIANILEVEKLQQQANDDDIANILYTSGTTGDSKGVILTHGQFHAAMIANGKCVPVNEDDRIMNFLPYTHIFERGWAILCLYAGAKMIVNTHPQEGRTPLLGEGLYGCHGQDRTCQWHAAPSLQACAVCRSPSQYRVP